MTLESTINSAGSISALSSDGEDLYWLQTVPEQDWRTCLMRRRGHTIQQVTPAPISVRSSVHEYGGGAYAVDSGYAVWNDATSHSLQMLDPHGVIIELTSPNKQHRYGSLSLNGAHDLLLAVREDHSSTPVVTTVVAIQLSAPHRTAILCQGADFYAWPVMNDRGDLAWVEWDQPAMPWDSSRLYMRTVHVDWRASTPVQMEPARLIAGMENAGLDGCSVQHPVWHDEHSLRFTCDVSGYYQLSCWNDGHVTALHSQPYDFDLPAFTVDNSVHASFNDGVLTCYHRNGYCYLAYIDSRGTHDLTSVSAVDSLCVAAGRPYAIIERPDAPPALVRINSDNSMVTIASPGASWNPAYTSVARSLVFDGRHGKIQAWYYPPTNPEYRAPSSQHPPMIVKVHGGPTSVASNGLYPMFQFWTSRGIAVLDVNYSGSAGFGRAWRNRLRGLWGVVDVDDCVDAADCAIDAGLADPGRIIIMGGSAGGYTALRALMTTDRFCAGISQYGVTDLRALRSGHKFESEYSVSLIGPWPKAEKIYHDRSPINLLDRLDYPIMILQGSDDPVVDKSQAISFYQAARDRGLPVVFELFDGQGHGFSEPVVKMRVLEMQTSFVAQICGFDVADEDLHPVRIENFNAKQ